MRMTKENGSRVSVPEISMVSAELLEFILNMLATIHNNTTAFGGINVVLIGNLAQLPPVTEYIAGTLTLILTLTD